MYQGPNTPELLEERGKVESALCLLHTAYMDGVVSTEDYEQRHADYCSAIARIDGQIQMEEAAELGLF